MDVILCRNVLMYFAPGRASEVVRKLHGCLVDGGWLIVGPSETSEVMFSEFATVNLPGITVYRKENRATQGTALSLPASDSDIFLPAADADSPLDGRGPGAEPGPCHAANQSVVPSAFRDELSASEESAPDPSEEGLRLCHQGRYGEAVDVLVAWLSQRPGDAQAMTLLARAYANQGRLADALEWCTSVIAADKLNPAVHYLAATIFQEQGRQPEAVASLQRAIYLDPDFTLAHVALGNLRQRQGRGPESRRHFENALRTLSHRSQEETVPESGGITTGRLTEIIQSASCFALGE
jgi:chemotaxis protein methyltransferase CheR